MANYTNPYTNAYGGYYQQNNYPQPNYNNAYNYQPMMAQQQTMPQIQQPNYLPLTYVNGEEGAKAYIVSPNTTIYLRDSDSNKLFIKSSDNNGKYTIEAYELTPVGENSQKAQISHENIDPNQFISKEQLSALESKFDAKLSKLQSKIDKLQVKKIIEE